VAREENRGKKHIKRIYKISFQKETRHIQYLMMIVIMKWKKSLKKINQSMMGIVI